MQPIERIFLGIPKEKLPELLEVLCAEKLQFAKNSLLLQQGEPNQYICLLLEGHAHAVRYAPDGREEDFALLQKGDLFGDALALSCGNQSPVRICADHPCTVLRFSYPILLKRLQEQQPYVSVLLKNLAEELACKFFAQQRRVQYLTRPSLREKLLAYLFDCRAEAKSDSFTIPLDRNALASFLYCDRSALSRELSRMQKEGILTCNRAHFTLHTPSNALFSEEKRLTFTE